MMSSDHTYHPHNSLGGGLRILFSNMAAVIQVQLLSSSSSRAGAGASRSCGAGRMLGNAQLAPLPSLHLASRGLGKHARSVTRRAPRRAVLSAASSGAADPVAAAEKRKARLIYALDESGGDPKDPSVTEVLADLEVLCEEGIMRSEANVKGTFRTISKPDFPECLGKDEEGRRKYTLGRMSFGMFSPKDTVCAIDNIKYTIGDLPGGKLSYDVANCFTVLDGPAKGLQGEIISGGECVPLEEGGDTPGGRVSVTFTGGSLKPISTTPYAHASPVNHATCSFCWLNGTRMRRSMYHATQPHRPAWARARPCCTRAQTQTLSPKLGRGREDLAVWNAAFGKEAVGRVRKRDRVAAWLLKAALGIEKPLGGADEKGKQEFKMVKPAALDRPFNTPYHRHL
mmetsp:Transcript_54854/g.174309  ORF Transcript_54854/g.174309 Transcript_54854/m.174309 type:complete len:398 (+) Transcript_54854:19-1212(+)